MDDRFSDVIIVYCIKNSCEIMLIRLIEIWRVELDSKRIVGILLLDMSKVFDFFSF